MARSRFGASLLRAGALSLVLGAAVSPAMHAKADDSPEVVRAREEFTEGVSLMAANDWAGALKKFKDVGRVKMSANVAFNIGECEDHLGLLVEALGDYRLAAAKAQDGSAPRVAQTVDDRIATVEKRIPHLTIDRDEPKPNPAASLQLDGVDVAPAEVGKPIAVNPGTRVVTIVVHGKAVKTENVEMPESAVKSVKMTIPEPVEGDTGDGGGGGDHPPPAKGPSIPGIVLSSVGGVSLVTGFVFIGLRQKAIGDLNTACHGTRVCPKSAQSTYDSGRTYTGVAEVTIPVGVAALATGLALVIVHGKKSPPKEEPPPTAAFDWSPAAPNADGPGASFFARF